MRPSLLQYDRLRDALQHYRALPSDDPKEGAVSSFFQWQDGKRVVFWPETGAVGELKLPPWMK